MPVKSKIIKQEIRIIRLKDLIPFDKNPQTMSDKEYKGLVDSMRKNGWLLDAPVCWLQKDEIYKIISGHHRISAGIEAGILETNCKVLTGLTEKQARLLVLEANQRLGKFDDKLLNDFIDSISIDFDIDLDSIYEDIGIINIQGENDPYEEWKDMPEYNNKDKTAFKSIILHFESQKAIDKFCDLVKQKITQDTKFLYFPKAKIVKVCDKGYES